MLPTDLKAFFFIQIYYIHKKNNKVEHNAKKTLTDFLSTGESYLIKTGTNVTREAQIHKTN